MPRKDCLRASRLSAPYVSAGAFRCELVKHRERVPGTWCGEVEVPRLSMRGQLELNVLWFALNAQSAALLPIVIPAQIMIFISSSQVVRAQQAYYLSRILIDDSIILLFMQLM